MLGSRREAATETQNICDIPVNSSCGERKIQTETAEKIRIHCKWNTVLYFFFRK